MTEKTKCITAILTSFNYLDSTTDRHCWHAIHTFPVMLFELNYRRYMDMYYSYYSSRIVKHFWDSQNMSEAS